MLRYLLYIVMSLVGAAVVYAASDRIIYEFEKDNDFCVACHLTDTTVLHEQLMADYRETADPRVLAAPHHSAETMVRCIDCHHGEGLTGRFLVLTVAGLDTVKWAAGLAEEPTELHLPFEDITCARCHAEAARAELTGGEYHNRAAHVDVPMRCIDCHAVHEPGDPALAFLDSDRVLGQCRTCHPDF